jgi:hypothetical protein
MSNLNWWVHQYHYRMKITEGRTDNLFIRDALMMINRYMNEGV